MLSPRHILILNFTLSNTKVKLTMSIISHSSFIYYFSACVIYYVNFTSILQLIEITLNIASIAMHCGDGEMSLFMVGSTWFDLVVIAS